MIPIAKPYIDEKEAQKAYDTILTGWITQGPMVKAFEDKFAAYTGAAHAVAVSNCTTALHLAMIVSGIKEGDEVICPSMSYIATANSIKYVGAVPVFAEVNELYNLDIEDVKARITPKTKAILIVHQIGLPADIDAFAELCREKGLQLIEDAACGTGSSYKGKKIGTHSDLVCFSFHPRKIISTGDGGMITTNNAAYAERLRLLRQHGMSVNDRVRHLSKNVILEEHVEVGYNYRMTDIQASVGFVQLDKLQEIIDGRREIAAMYLEGLKDLDTIRLPYEPEGYFTNWQSFCIYLKPNCKIARNDLMQVLLEEGIASRRGIMLSHKEPAYKEYNSLSLPFSEELGERCITIPLYYPMEKQDVQKVIDAIKKFAQ